MRGSLFLNFLKLNFTFFGRSVAAITSSRRCSKRCGFCRFREKWSRTPRPRRRHRRVNRNDSSTRRRVCGWGSIRSAKWFVHALSRYTKRFLGFSFVFLTFNFTFYWAHWHILPTVPFFERNLPRYLKIWQRFEIFLSILKFLAGMNELLAICLTFFGGWQYRTVIIFKWKFFEVRNSPNVGKIWVVSYFNDLGTKEGRRGRS